jgi:predicted porin
MGVSGGFGEIRAGRQYTLGFMSSSGYMASTSTTAQVVFANNATMGAAPVAPALGTAPSNGTNYFNAVGSRNDAQLRYSSPSFGGVKVDVATQLTGNTAAPLTEVQVAYGVGPVNAAFYASSTKGTDGTNMGINGSYDFGMVKALGGFVDRAGSKTGKGYFVGATAPVGPVNLIAVYANNSDTSVSAVELGARYPLSKRTTLYTHYRTGSKLPVKSLFVAGLDHNF